MKLANIMTNVTKMVANTRVKIDVFRPEIYLCLGIAGGIGATVLACQATLKVEAVMTEHDEKIEKIADCWEKVKEGDIPLDDYSDTDHKKDLAIVYTQTGVNFVKLYGPAVSLGVLSVGFIIGGHRILKKRNVALMAAYRVVSEGFAAYRKRVVADHGEETDYMYKNGLYAEEVTEAAYTDEAGVKHKAQKVKKLVSDPNQLNAYSKFFDDSCTQWSSEPDYNMMFLRAQQNYYNEMLRSRGHVFLNEVYDALGIPRTEAGAIVGWVLGEGRDNFIDFGIFDGGKRRVRDFVNGYEKSILLDFNVDGVIFDLFTKNKV